MKKTICCMLVFASLFFCTPAEAASAQSYIVIEQSSGRVLFESNADACLPMASTTKIMTALLVLENTNIDQEYTVPDAAVGIEGSSIYLEKGEKLTVRELLYGLMLASGNDAAYALAILTAGSPERFVAMMNMKAVALGMEHTRFANPCGLHDSQHYTTARDMARLCACAMRNPAFTILVSTQTYQIRGPEGKTRFLHNKNRILGECPGGNGIKTGYTKAAGRCLCSSATREDMTLICVVLNDPNWFADSKELLNQGFSQYKMTTIVEKDQVLGNAFVHDGKTEVTDLITAEKLSYPVKNGEKVTVEQDFCTEFRAPVEAGQKAGEVKIKISGRQIGQIDVIIKNSIKKKGLFQS